MQRRIFTHRSINLLAKRSINLWYVLIDLSLTFFFAPINKEKKSDSLLEKKTHTKLKRKKNNNRNISDKIIMSNKRPLSPESTNGLSNDNQIRSLKRLKLHSIIEELRNEEANLVLLKKLRASQQITTRTNNNSTTTNGFHPTTTSVAAARVPAPTTTTKPTSAPIPPSIKQPVQQPLSSAIRKPINPPLTTKIPTALPGKTSSSTTHSLEERKAQAKKTLRNQLERDLLNIPAPKPSIQDISFIPNPASLEFQPYIGLEDVVQCLFELQTERQRLPQRFTDRAQIDEPFICDHCGTDYTIRWWKQFNQTEQINVLCDRCKKQVTRRTLKSEHSALLKNVFVSAMEQEKEIEKTFQTLIKQQQQKAASRTSTPSVPAKPITNNRPILPPAPPATLPQIPSLLSFHTNHQKPKHKTPIPSAHNFATKLSQQSAPPSMNAARKSNTVVPSSHHRPPMPAHQQQQQYRSTSALPHSTKTNPMIKPPKTTATRQQPALGMIPPRPMFPSTGAMLPSSNHHPSLTSSGNVRPTATKRRTLPPINMK